MYGYTPFKDLCLEAQDRYGADVNLLLLCAWIDAMGYVVSTEARPDLLACSSRYQKEILQPLRRKRSSFDRGSKAYADALVLELEAERAAQEAYVAILNNIDGRNTAKDVDWVTWYWDHLGDPQLSIRLVLDEALKAQNTPHG